MQVDVENAFNNAFQAVIFLKIRNVKGPLANIVPFTKMFYGIHSSIFYHHGQHEEGITIIESSLSTKQGDPPRRSFIYLNPLSNTPKYQCVNT
jgi:hypothetical protein